MINSISDLVWKWSFCDVANCIKKFQTIFNEQASNITTIKELYNI